MGTFHNYSYHERYLALENLHSKMTEKCSTMNFNFVIRGKQNTIQYLSTKYFKN